MEKKKFISLICLIAITIGGCTSNPKDQNSGDGDSVLSQKHELLKEYALCDCVKYSLPNDSIKNDVSLGVLGEISDYGYSSVYTRIDSVSKAVASSIKPLQVADYNGKKAPLLDCINYYHSKKLDSLVKGFDHLVR